MTRIYGRKGRSYAFKASLLSLASPENCLPYL